ncbi:MarR family winged helix-turn-helix transcriptional regulator [Nitratireductor sp. GCM10026969]|uniref:MarR family winged helix-turn-helix transcriptional regulator n=1 Tax=Nitratireductor sp. GCM10026969 TaxID=3252645 RepID=UPI00361C7030
MPESKSAPPNSAPSTSRALAEDLHWCAVRLARGLGSIEERVVREHQLSLRGYVVLTAIAEQPMASQLEIARLGAFDKSVLVGLLDELEGSGLVVRTPDPSDRRAKLLRITDKGEEVLAAATAAVVDIENALLASIPASSRDGFLAALRQVGNSDFAATFSADGCS